MKYCKDGTNLAVAYTSFNLHWIDFQLKLAKVKLNFSIYTNVNYTYIGLQSNEMHATNLGILHDKRPTNWKYTVLIQTWILKNHCGSF